MADDEQGDGPDPRWTVRLDEVERLEREEGDEGETYFDVSFSLSGLGVNGNMLVLIEDPASEANIISEALAQLKDGLETFTRVLARRLDAERAKATDGA